MNVLLAIEAWVALALAQVAMRLRPDIAMRLGSESDEESSREVPTAVVEHFREVARTHVLAPACLARALALRLVLSRRGVPAVLRMGLDRESKFPGHAWIEVDSVPVAEAESFLGRFGKMQIDPQEFAASLRRDRRSRARWSV